MSLLQDPLTIEINKFDWRNCTLDDAKDKFIELTNLYDFKDKVKLHQFDVMSKRSTSAIHKFIAYAAWNGYEIKARIKLAK